MVNFALQLLLLKFIQHRDEHGHQNYLKIANAFLMTRKRDKHNKLYMAPCLEQFLTARKEYHFCSREHHLWRCGIISVRLDHDF